MRQIAPGLGPLPRDEKEKGGDERPADKSAYDRGHEAWVRRPFETMSWRVETTLPSPNWSGASDAATAWTADARPENAWTTTSIEPEPWTTE